MTVVTPKNLSKRQRELFQELEEELDTPYDGNDAEGLFGKVKDIFG